MKKTVILLFVLLFSQISVGQDKYMSKEGRISFYSHTPIEDITAVNEKVAAVIDRENSAVAIIVPMNEFKFERKLMQEHFNENYVESEKYPKASFSGRISGMEKADYQNPGMHQVTVTGEMTIHGITRDLSTEGSIEVSQKGITARTKFQLNPEDYGIKIPKVVRRNIAEKMEINAEFECRPF